MYCRYCDSKMMGQDNDRMGYNLHSRIHICMNDKCKAVYEEWTDDKGVSLPDKNKWFNPETEDFEN